MPTPVRILMTCAGGATIAHLVAALGRSAHLQITVFGCDSKPTVNQALPEVHIVPAGADPAYPAAMLALAQKLSVDLIWPGSDEEAMALSAAQATFDAAGVRLLVSGIECLQLLSNKAEVYRRLADAGIPHPEYRVIEGWEDLRNALSTYDFPRQGIAVKPVSGRGGRGVVILPGDADVDGWIGSGARETRAEGAKIPDSLLVEKYPAALMAMPLMGGPVYDADVCAVRGKPVAMSVRKRHNPTGIPYTGNLVFRDEKLEQFCAAVAAAVGLDALHDYDLMTDRQGDIRLLEVNPRPSGSFISTVAAGSNLAEVAIAAKLGLDIPYRSVVGSVEVWPENGVLKTRRVE